MQVTFAAFTLTGESWTYFYGPGFALELVLLAVILRYAWAWPRTSRAGVGSGSPETAEPFAPSSTREPGAVTELFRAVRIGTAAVDAKVAAERCDGFSNAGCWAGDGADQ